MENMLLPNQYRCQGNSSSFPWRNLIIAEIMVLKFYMFIFTPYPKKIYDTV